MSVLGRTKSICPECFKTLEAQYQQEEDQVRLYRECPEHGEFSEIIWQGSPSFQDWKRPGETSKPEYTETLEKNGCPHDCGRCPRHKQHSCTVLVEITNACNLKCPVCFASSGENSPKDNVPGNSEVSLEKFTPLKELEEQLKWIRKHAGEVVLQLSGGEPSLHPELLEIIKISAELFPAVQLNTNGILLATKENFARDLAEAGLGWVFLQFDGTSDKVYKKMRGRPLWETKKKAVKECLKAGLPLVLVPTLARGVNDSSLGDILDFALEYAPAIRGIHIQPMALMGRNLLAKENSRLTLPEVLTALADQSKGRIKVDHATAPACEHERCSFHCRYHINKEKELIPISEAACCTFGQEAQKVGQTDLAGQKKQSQDLAMAPQKCCPHPLAEEKEAGTDGAKRAISTLLRSWGNPGSSLAQGDDALSRFIRQSQHKSFSVTCMAFQDAGTLDLQRVQQCCVHIFSAPHKLIPFCSYNLTAPDGRTLHRGK